LYLKKGLWIILFTTAHRAGDANGYYFTSQKITSLDPNLFLEMTNTMEHVKTGGAGHGRHVVATASRTHSTAMTVNESGSYNFKIHKVAGSAENIIGVSAANALFFKVG